MRRYRIAFTDARGRAKNATCNRWGHEGIGGVLLSAEGIFFFFASASQSDVEAWLPPQREARINEAESLGPLLLVHSLANMLQDSDCIVFVDSSAAEGILINSYGKSAYLTAIAGAFWQQVGSRLAEVIRDLLSLHPSTHSQQVRATPRVKIIDFICC